MVRKVRAITIALDLSGSMEEIEPSTGEKKKIVAAEHIVKGLCDVVSKPGNWNQVKSKAHKTTVGISIFGVDSGSNLVLLEPMTLLDLRKLASDGKCDNLRKRIIDSVKQTSGNGTSAVQLVEGIIDLLRKVVAAQTSSDRGVELRVLALVYSDGCFNIFRGHVGNVYEGTAQAREELVTRINQVVLTGSTPYTKPESLLRGIIMLLYGDESMVEADTGICPKRAALFASSLDELPDAVRREFQKLLSNGILSLSSDLAELDVDGNSKVKDYAVAKVVMPADLAAAIATITTSVTGG